MTTSNASTRVSIRSATPADREFVLHLADRLADFDRPAWRTREEIVHGDRQALAEAFDSPAAGTALFVAELDGTPAACLLVWTLEDYFTRQRHAHVSVIAVARDCEGRGVGARLMQHAEAWARERGHRRLTLSVFEGNRRAQALYARQGFQTEMRRLVKILSA
jgi:ribosomal protein S18 acetylase RimI-like enzyme